MKKRIEKILNDNSLLLTQKYFEIQKLAEEKYGKNSIVFIEIGTFFEVYEVNNDNLKLGKAKEVAELLNIQLTRKNKNILENDEKNPLMAGVPNVSFEKHLTRLIALEKYTIIVIKQIGTPPKVKRVVDYIISPGTNFEYVINNEEIFLTSIFIDKVKNNYLVAFSSIDVTTGKCFYNEVYGTSEDNMFGLDELFNYLIVNKSSEVIITFLDKDINQKEVLDYLELSSKTIHINTQRVKVSYQNELFKKVFEIKSLLTPIEALDMETFSLASESLAILIDFIIEHDSDIVRHLKKPVKLNNKKYLYLGNNALEQLNIISKNLPNLLNVIDFTSTAMGKRLLKERLSHPIKDKEELERRYDLSSNLFEYFTALEDNLSQIYDIERLSRRIKLNRIHPFELYYLYESLLAIKKIVGFMKTHLFLEPPCEIQEIELFIKDINNSFYIKKAAKFMLKDININIIKPNNDSYIDKLEKENQELYKKLELIKNHIASFLDNEDFITINRLEKEGFYFNITKSRFSAIKEKLLDSHIVIDKEVLIFKNFKFKIQSQNVKISSNYIDKITDRYVSNLSKIISLNKSFFKDKISFYDKNYSLLLENLVNFIAEIDVAISNIKASKKYNLKRAKILDNQKDENFLELKDIRHLLIELNEEKGIYIPNDIVLGSLSYASNDMQNNVIIKAAKDINRIENKIEGVLLYGINSSGKSSLMKSIGIAIILAQSGFFVPATSMRFMLFDTLFTRISGADNIARGLSSFAVEMLELKNIFNRATKHSIILGDEISHSTETLSGLSIVASAIVKLSKLEPIFIFATHLHQLVELEEIKKLKNIVSLHLSVIYDEKEDKLIYGRKLKLGSGSSLYGLEFAKSLHLDKEFLSLASKIRKKLTNDLEDIERLSKKRKSKYNKELYLSSCVICGEKAEDTHHIKEQSKANENGFVNHFNKNHKFNLLPLCKKHHKMVHNGEIIINGFISTSKGLELHYDIIKK